jgi:hypothetical protein
MTESTGNTNKLEFSIKTNNLFMLLVESIVIVLTKDFHVKWVSCQNGMLHPQVVDTDGLQIWRVAANILDKQSRTADRGWPSSLGVGRGANNPTIEKLYLLRSMYKGLRNGRIPWHDLSTEKGYEIW